MRLEATYLNGKIELFDGLFDEDRAAELRAVLPLYNRLIGPVTGVSLVRPEILDLSLYSGYCRHAPLPSLIVDLVVKAAPHAGFVPGGGKGGGQLSPLLGALGEISERLLAMLHVTTLVDRIVYASYEELSAGGHEALAPEELPLFAPEQYAMPGFEYEPFFPDTVVGWVQGADLLGGQTVFVPAQLVLMYQKRDAREASIGYATTAGLAFHPSRKQSILHGLYEVIERDALNVCWYSRLAPPRVEVDLGRILAETFGIWRARMSSPYVRDVGIYLMTLDCPIPVLAAVAFDQSRADRAFLGGTGASSRPERALGQALFELGQCQTGFRFEDPFGRNPIYEDTALDNVVEFFDAPLYYGHARNLPRTFWFTENANIVPWDSLPMLYPRDEHRGEDEEYELMVRWLQTAGVRVIVLDFGDACLPGSSITKVFVPKLTHACPPRNPMLGHPRFTEIPVRLGRANHPLTFRDLNPDPIPFA